MRTSAADLRAAVLTVSDSAHSGTREDASGPAVAAEQASKQPAFLRRGKAVTTWFRTIARASWKN